MMWISLGPMHMPIRSPGVQARVEWISHSRPSQSTCISKWTPLKITSFTTPVSWPSMGATTSMSSGRMTTWTLCSGLKPRSTQGNCTPAKDTRKSRCITPSMMFESPMKSATKAFFGSL